MMMALLITVAFCWFTSISAFAPLLVPSRHGYYNQQQQQSPTNTRTTLYGTIIDGLVEFDTLAREWRCKYDGDASLISAQVALESILDDLKEVDGVTSVERIVCGDCLDFKIITSLEEDKFAAWEKDEFDPEVYFIEMLEDIDGISMIETQTYTKVSV